MNYRRVSAPVCVAIIVTLFALGISALPSTNIFPISGLDGLLSLIRYVPVNEPEAKPDGPQIEASITTLGSPYTQNFDSLTNVAGTFSSTLPSGWALAESLANANTTYATGIGSSTTGDTYNFGKEGTNPDTDRAFGMVRSTTLLSTIGSSFSNATGATITSLQISYVGEEWRLGTAARTDQINFEYSIDATSLSTGTWTPVAALSFVTPNITTSGAKDGNAAENRTALGTTISGVNIPNGTTFWIRWIDFDAASSDDGLAIDDFSLTANGAVVAPEVDVKGNSVSIADGDATPSLTDHTDFGSVNVSGTTSITRTFFIENTGNANLSLTGGPLVAISGPNAINFQLVAGQGPFGPVLPGDSTSFQIRFDPDTVGVKTATLTIPNNDPNENPYNFDIQGTGTADTEPTLTATGLNPTFTGGGAAVDLYSAVSVSTVEAGQTLKRLDFFVTSLSDGASENIIVDGSTIPLVEGTFGTTATNGFSYSVSKPAGTATVSLTKAAGISEAAMAAVVDGLAYQNTSGTATAGARAVTLARLDDSGLTTPGNDNSADLNISSTVTVTLTPKYRSATFGNWNSTATWQQSTDGGTNWVAATTTPTAANADSVVIRLEHEISITSPITVDQVSLGEGSLNIESGGTMTINDGPGVDFTIEGSTSLFNLKPGGTLANGGQVQINGYFQQYGGTVTGNSLVYGFPTGSLTYVSGIYTTNDLEYPAVNSPPNVYVVAATATLHGPRTITSETALGADGVFNIGTNLTMANGTFMRRLSDGTAFNGTPNFLGRVNLQYENEDMTTGPEVPAASNVIEAFGVIGDIDVTLGSDVTTQFADFASGRIITGANTLTTSGSDSTAGGYVIGNLKRVMNLNLGTTPVPYPVGTANGYSPVTLTYNVATAGTYDQTVSATQGAHPNLSDPTKALSRYWTLSSINGPAAVTADITFNYLDPADIPGTATEANFVIQKYDGLFTRPGGSVNTAANSASINGVSSFSDWTLAEPSVVGVPEINVTGNNVSIADGDTTPFAGDHTDFGNVPLGQNLVRTFTIQNTGTADVNLTGTPNLVDIIGPGSGNFSVSSAPTTPIPPGGSTTFQISFSTIDIGLYSTTISIPNSDADEGIYDFNIQAIGIGAPVVLTNAASLVVDTMATLNGEANPRGDAAIGWFRYSTTDPGTCNDSFGTRTPSIGGDPLGSGTISTGFNEQITGLTSGTTYYFCAIAENSVGKSFGMVQSFGTPSNPTGTGQATPSGVGPGGNVTLTVAVTPGVNPPSAGIQVIADLTSIGGLASQPFFDDGVTGGDAVAGDNIYTFATTVGMLATPGLKSVPFTVSDLLARSSDGSISLTVNEPAPDISVEDHDSNLLVDEVSTVDLGTETVGAPGTARTFTVRNTGSATLNVNVSINVDGLHPGDFVVDSTGMSPLIGPGGHTAFTVTFTPNALGERSAALHISSDDPDENPFDIDLTGNGDAAPTPTPTPSPSPTTLVVDNLTDDGGLNECTPADGDCSLSGANSIAHDGDTITFAPGVLLPEAAPTIELAGQIVITQDITITGPGQGALTVQNTAAASATSRIFEIDSAATVTISGLTLTGGNTTGDGGAISNVGNLALTSMLITANSAGATNANGGGGIANQGTITITASTISGNTAAGGGGGLLMVNGGTANIIGSTFSVNASGGGGAILSQAISLPANLTITNSTISGNTGPPCSGVWNLGAMATATVTSSTITNNVAGNGSLCAFGPTTIRNTIVARNQNVATDLDTSGAFISEGYNLIGNVGTATGFTGLGDHIGGGANPVIDFNLGPLANNGGPTFTHKPQNGFPGQDKGCAFGSTIDQRGMQRIVDWPNIPNGLCDGTDIGSVELVMPTAGEASISGWVTTMKGGGISNVSVTVRNTAGESVGTAVTNTFGYFTVGGLAAGASYVISATSKGYGFEPSNQVVMLDADVSDLNFIAKPTTKRAR